jgi:hypothetical protein
MRGFAIVPRVTPGHVAGSARWDDALERAGVRDLAGIPRIPRN